MARDDQRRRSAAAANARRSSEAPDEFLLFEYGAGSAFRKPERDPPISEVPDKFPLFQASHEGDFTTRAPEGNLPSSQTGKRAPPRTNVPHDTEFAIRRPSNNPCVSLAQYEPTPIDGEANQGGISPVEALPIPLPDNDLIYSDSADAESADMADPGPGPWQQHEPPGWYAPQPYQVMATAHEAPAEDGADCSANAPAWCWIHFWYPRTNMYQRDYYFPESHGRYYMHPYNPADIAIHQEFAASIGGDPRHPYSHKVFEQEGPDETPATQSFESESHGGEANPGSGQLRSPRL